MKIKRSAEDITVDVSLYIFLTLFALITLYPLWYVLIASFSNSRMLISHSGLLLTPLGFNLDSYKTIIDYTAIWSGFKNSIFLVVGGLAVNLTLTTLGAYFISRKDVMLGRPITLFMLFTMYFGGGLVPCYLNIRSLGLYDSLWAVILSTGLSTYNMIIMRTNFATIPRSLEESAELDGANDFIILFRILLPLSSSILAVMVLYYGVANWNGWFNAMIYLSDETKIPLQLVLRNILIQQENSEQFNGGGDTVKSVEESIKYAIIMVSTIPVLILYPFLQKYFVKGVIIGSVKG